MTTIELVQVGATEAPIACTLTPDDLRARTAELSALAARALTADTPIPGGRRLTFTDTPEIERELRAAIVAEASCCAFLSLRLARTDGALVLDVTGPAEAQPIVAELFACAPTPPRRPA